MISLEWKVNTEEGEVCECSHIVPNGEEGLYDHASEQWYCRECAKGIIKKRLELLQELWYKIEDTPKDIQQVSRDVMSGKVKKSDIFTNLSKRCFPGVSVKLHPFSGRAVLGEDEKE